MSYIQRVAVSVTTAADGSATVTSDPLNGLISSIRYVKDGTNGFTDGATITITNDKTGESVWAETGVNTSATRAPRQPTHSTAGAAALYAAGGAAVDDQIAFANERARIVIANGGNAKAATFYISVE